MSTSGAVAPVQVPVTGKTAALATFNIQTLTVNVWHDTPHTITLPSAGRYRIGGAISGQVAVLGSSIVATSNNGTVFVQLVDAGGVVIPLSGRVVAHVTKPDGNLGAGNMAVMGTAPMDLVDLTVTGPTTLRLQARRGGATTIAAVCGNGLGPSHLSYEKLA